MQTKRAFFLFLLFCVGVGVILFFLQRVSRPGTTDILPSPSTIPVETAPRTINFPPIPQDASFTYSGSPKAIPEALTVYQYSYTTAPQALTTFATKISSELGLQSTPSAIIDGQSFAFTRTDKNKSFVLAETNDLVSITYQRNLVEDSSLFFQEDTASAAASFFSSFFPLPTNALFTFLSSNSGDGMYEGIVILERPIPDLKDYVFGLSIQSVPLLTTEYTNRWASTIIDNRGAVRVANFILPPVVTPAGQTRLISIEQAMKNINEGRGSLVWITQTTGDQYGVVPSFKKGTLTDVSLVYIHRQGKLIPAYLFDGSGPSENGTLQVFSLLVLATAMQ
jgi:hypothetical protein